MAKKPTTYKTFLKDNAVPKDKVSDIIPKNAVLADPNTLPPGLDSSLRASNGEGTDEFCNMRTRDEPMQCFTCKQFMGEWFVWSKEKK